MKKKLFSEKWKKEFEEQLYKRKSLIWECVRRNKDYHQDFQTYGGHN